MHVCLRDLGGVMGLYEPLPAVSDPYRPNAARLHDYYLGGTDNLEVDRRAAEKIRAVVPEMSDAAWANRGFLQRATKWIAEQDVRQFSTSAPACPPGTTHTPRRRTWTRSAGWCTSTTTRRR